VERVAGESADNPECFLHEAPDPRENPSELLEHRELDAFVTRTLATLPARERDVVVLCDIEDFPSAAAAKRLGLSKARTRAALHRARVRLREDLAPLMRLSAAK
jgi:RNA polymerase sigma-70 factor, ECF subfamily